MNKLNITGYFMLTSMFLALNILQEDPLNFNRLPS